MSRALSQIGHADYAENGYGGTQPELVIDYRLIERGEQRQSRVDNDFLDSNGMDLLSELRDAAAARTSMRAAAFVAFGKAWADRLAEYVEGRK